MLQRSLNVHHNIDITKFFKLKALLKRKSNGYSETLMTKQINRFIRESPDSQQLLTKVECWHL